MAKIFKNPSENKQCGPKQSLSFPVSFFFPLGDERTGTEIKFSASHEKKNIWFQVFIRNAGGTKQQIFPPAAAVGAGPLLSHIGEHNPHAAFRSCQQEFDPTTLWWLPKCWAGEPSAHHA